MACGFVVARFLGLVDVGTVEVGFHRAMLSCRMWIAEGFDRMLLVVDSHMEMVGAVAEEESRMELVDVGLVAGSQFEKELVADSVGLAERLLGCGCGLAFCLEVGCASLRTWSRRFH